MRKLLLLISSFILLCTVSSAQEISDIYVTSDTLQIYFRQDSINLNPRFRDNGARLEEFSSYFYELLSDPQNKVRSILIVSGASPEGLSTRNRYLSDNRAKVMYDYLIENNLAAPDHIEVESRGVDWMGLELRVARSDLPYKDEVLEMINLPDWIKEDGVIVDGRKQRLMNYRGGTVWRELYDLYFADLRGTRVMIAYNILKIDTQKFEPIAPKSTQIEFPVEGDIVRFPMVQPKQRPLYLAIESNLLYDAAVVPNIGGEVGVYRGVTVGANYQNIWLRDKAWTRWYRFEGFDAGVNLYLNEEHRPLRGHHVGLYGQMATWDFTINGRGYLTDRWAFGGGVSYGYALPIGRRFNLDFEIGIGYLGGNIHEYIPQDGHRIWQFVKPFHYFGPTKVGVTLQWLIGPGNYNERRVRGR